VKRPRLPTNAAQHFLQTLGRAPGAIGSGAKGFWFGLSLRARQRLALAILGAVIAAVLLAFAVPRLPCQLPGGDICAPDDDAEQLVPADALAYAHLTLGAESEQFEDARETLDALPGITRQLVARLLAQVPGPGGEPADFDRDIAPWLGGQAAIAIVPGGGAAEQVQLLQEGDPEGAAEFAASLAAGTPATEEYRGVELAVDARGLATASVGGFLAIGTEEGVRRVLDVDTEAEGARPLSDDPVASELRDELPPERFVDVYVSPDGIESLIAAESSPLATLEPFVDAAASEGAAASLGAGEGSLELAIRSSLDPQRARSDPGFFAAFPPFDPELPERLAADALGYVGIGDPGTTVNELLAQATAEAPALAQGLTEAANRLRELGDVKVEEELLPALGGEGAFALQPGADRSSRPEPDQSPAVPEGLPQGPAPIPEEAVPVLQFLADGVDTERARQSLAQLRGSIAEALDPGESLQAPVFDSRTYEGVDLEVLRISPTVELTYAVAGESLAVATQPSGVEQVIDGEGGLDEADRYEDALEGFPEEPSLLAYLNLSGLIELGEREGLAEDPVYAVFAPEVRRLEAAGLAVEAESTTLATEARVVISQGGDGEASGGSEQPSD
jgi:Protein of unknown function (DUF3352)